MPMYDFECNDCHRTLEKHQTFAKMKRTPTLPCECGGRMTRLIGAPAIMSDTRFFAGMGDGLGNDQQARVIAHRRARAAGVDTTGMTYFPQLCRKGKPFDPAAWCHDRSDIKRKLMKLGKGAEGSINIATPEQEPDKPYRVAEDIVNRATADEIRKQKLVLSPAERRAMKEKVRADITPVMD